jgi:hypothetical protein
MPRPKRYIETLLTHTSSQIGLLGHGLCRDLKGIDALLSNTLLLHGIPSLNDDTCSHCLTRVLLGDDRTYTEKSDLMR